MVRPFVVPASVQRPAGALVWHPAVMTDAPEDGPSLEMPSFSLRRRRTDAAADGAAAAPAPAPAPAPEPAPEPEPEPAAEPDPDRPAPTNDVRRAPVALGGLAAASLTGLLVGALAVAVGWASGVACEAVRGTSSCGGAVGLPILLASVVLLAWVGGLLLGALGVRDARSTSLLAVGVLAVLVMVFLLGSLDEWRGVVAVPVAAVVAYVGSWRLTTAVAAGEDTATEASYDVR